MKEKLRDIRWETLSDAETLDKLNSDRTNGLANEEAANRLDIFGAVPPA